MLGKNILKEVSQRAVQIRKKLTDKEFFLSSNVKTYFDNIIMVITKRYNRKISLTLDYSNNQVDAYTDFNKIYVNIKSELVEFYSDLKSKLLCLLGLVSHECAHILFMSFIESEAANKSILNGKLYGEEPKSNEKAKNELVFLLEKSNIARRFIASLVMDIENTIADEHDENKMIERFPGLIATSISYPKGAMHSLTPCFTDRIQKNKDELSIILSLIFSHTRFGRSMEREEYQMYKDLEYVQVFDKCKSFVDEAIKTDSAFDRFSLINEILVNIWSYILPKIKENDNRIKNKSTNSQKSGNGKNNSSSKNSEESENTNNSENEDEDDESEGTMDNEDDVESSENGDSETENSESKDDKSEGTIDNEDDDDESNENGDNVAENSESEDYESEGTMDNEDADDESNENGDNEVENSESEDDESDANSNNGADSNSSTLDFDDSGDFDMDGVENALKEIANNISNVMTQKAQGNTQPVSEDPLNERSDSDKESIENQVKKDIENILKEITEEEAVTQLEEERLAETLNQLKNIDYSSTHNNITLRFHRDSQVHDSEKCEYNLIFNKLRLSSKAMQRGIKQILKDKREGGKLYGEVYGKRFESKCVSRMDSKYFSKNKLQTEPPTLLVGVLVDESGSMFGERINMARKATILLNDFTEELEIPTIIYGHSTMNEKVDIFSYVEPEKYTKDDKYRLVNIKARDCNRDGLALRIICEKMAKRQEEIKLLIVISDGQPSHYDYFGEEAVEDMQNICKEFRKKGIKIFAAAIGNDKDRLHNIYGDYFLDITDLEKLPKLMVNLVKKHIQV